MITQIREDRVAILAQAMNAMLVDHTHSSTSFRVNQSIAVVPDRKACCILQVGHEEVILDSREIEPLVELLIAAREAKDGG